MYVSVVRRVASSMSWAMSDTLFFQRTTTSNFETKTTQSATHWLP